MDIKEVLDKYGTPVNQKTKYNQYSTHSVIYNFKPDEVEKFNEIYLTLKNSDMHKITRTKSGGIAKGHHYHNYYAWDISKSTTGLRITAIIDGCTYCFKIGAFTAKDSSLPSWKAWNMFNDKCNELNINLEDYAISEEEGWKWKEKIPKPYIQTFYDDQTLDNCHHIDFHNSYPSGLVNTHPEFYDVVNYFYTNRKTNPEYKDVLNITVGKMQSKSNPKWAHLSYDAITDNNNRIKELTAILTITGRKIVGFNTDGIWYQGDIYHGPGEGKNLGEWENDHINCIFRSKSKGAYQFIEDNKVHTVLRGYTHLDRVVKRDDWKWGDIYNTDANILNWKFDKDKGVIVYE